LEKDMTELLKVKPWGEGQGDYVLIEAGDFDTDFHELLDAAPAAPKKLGIAELRDTLKAKGIDFPDDAKKADLQALLDAAPAAG
jgi:hypothetical protein